MIFFLNAGTISCLEKNGGLYFVTGFIKVLPILTK